jgi:N-acetyl-gamma-glutamyl-phosphate reductase
VIEKERRHYESKNLTIKVGVLGVTGYTGKSLVRLIQRHPQFLLSALFSTTIQGRYSDYLPEFFDADFPDVVLYDTALCSSLDLIFLAVPHTKSMPIVADLMAAFPTLKIVDLSADFRLNSAIGYESVYGVPHTAADGLNRSVYGLPERHMADIKNTQLCANPGCYATSMVLGLLPLVNHLDPNTPIVIDSKSGVSGAGKALKESSLFCETHNQLSAYQTGTHRHLAEVVQETGFTNVMFSPHLVPMFCGIESAIYIHSNVDNLAHIYHQYYESHSFVRVLGPHVQPSTRLVVHTNYCVIIPKKVGDWVVVFSLIDNLIKGASGQAIQNANIMFGLNEAAGLN